MGFQKMINSHDVQLVNCETRQTRIYWHGPVPIIGKQQLINNLSPFELQSL